MTESNLSDGAFVALVAVIGIGAFFYKATLGVNWDEVLHNVIFFGGIGLAVIVVLIIFVVIVRRHLRQVKADRISHENSISHAKNELSKIVDKHFSSSTDVDDAIAEVKELIEYNLLIELDKDYDNAIKYLTKCQNELIAKEDDKEKEDDLEREKVTEIYEYFVKKKTCEHIPAFAIYYSSDIIETAREKYEKMQKMSKEQHAIREEATDFITRYGAFPTNFASMRPVEQVIYKEVFEDYQSGKIVSIQNVKHSDRELFKQGFVVASELIKPLQERFVSEYGFRKIFFTGLKGKGEYVLVRNDTRKESDYHFCWKNIFGSLPKAEIEKEIDGWRTDVAFSLKGKNIAFEIETGSNKNSQLLNKRDWLNRHFDYWCFICQRKDMAKYRKLVDKKKSFVFTTGEAYDWLTALNKG